MSFNLDNDSKKLMEQINNLIDEKLVKLRKEQNEAEALAKNEISASIEKRLKDFSIKEVDKEKTSVFNLSPEELVQVYPFLILKQGAQLNECQIMFNEAVKKFNLDKPCTVSVSSNRIVIKAIKLYTETEGSTFWRAFSVEDKQSLTDFWRLTIPTLVNQLRSVAVLEFNNVLMNQNIADGVLQIQIDVQKLSFQNGDLSNSIQLSAQEFLDFSQKVAILEVHAYNYPLDFLNNEFMCKLIELENTVLTRLNHCLEKSETSLTDDTLKALQDRETVRTNFDVCNYYNSFTVRRIRKLVQRCMNDKVEKVNYSLGILKSDQKTAALLLMQEINENPQHPYVVSLNKICESCERSEEGFLITNRTSTPVETKSMNEQKIRIRFNVRND